MILTDEERKRLGTIDPEYVEAIEKWPKDFDMASSDSNPREARAAWLKTLRHLYPIPGPIPDSVTETHHKVTARDGYEIPIIIYKPVRHTPKSQHDGTGDKKGGSPLIVMFHEGGFCMGDLTDEETNCRMFTRDLGAVCVNVKYRLGPEHKFPTGVNDCWDVLEWAASECSNSSSTTTTTTKPDNEELSLLLQPANPRERGFIVGGARAGGNLAAVMCQLARDRALSPPLTGQYLCCPTVIMPSVIPPKWKDDYRSIYESHSDPVIDFPASDPLETILGTVQPDINDPLFCPLLHENLGGLPRAYFQIGGLDPLRDEGLIYEEELKRNGTITKTDVYAGFGHMFWTNWPQMERSREFVRDTLAGVRWLLS